MTLAIAIGIWLAPFLGLAGLLVHYWLKGRNQPAPPAHPRRRQP